METISSLPGEGLVESISSLEPLGKVSQSLELVCDQDTIQQRHSRNPRLPHGEVNNAGYPSVLFCGNERDSS